MRRIIELFALAAAAVLTGASILNEDQEILASELAHEASDAATGFLNFYGGRGHAGHGKTGAYGRAHQWDQEDRDDLLTTGWGANVLDSDSSLKAGENGPTLLQDFQFLEKIGHFDRERVPERVVHARGSGIGGHFVSIPAPTLNFMHLNLSISLQTLHKDMSKYTKAKIFGEVGVQTPVFVRFSTVAGSMGSADPVRDVRGFATKFYTKEGNWDLVGNNIPVFFIQDAIHFCTLTPESTHMLMWVFSDRTLPRSFRTMSGFGVHSFKLVNAAGKTTFVKFHWKPKYGIRSLMAEELNLLRSENPDYHREDLYEAAHNGIPGEWELGLQLITVDVLKKLDIDILDPTKIVPEEEVPIEYVGTMVLDTPPTNFFAQTEQVALTVTHLIPGIEVSDDPLLQGRVHSYIDTQHHRFGSSANFDQLPINAPIAPVRNNQRDGFARITVNRDTVVNYCPNSLGTGCPSSNDANVGEPNAYIETPELLSRGTNIKVRGKPVGFSDHYSQAQLFYNSQPPIVQEHIALGIVSDLSNVKSTKVVDRAIEMFNRVDHELAMRIAEGLGRECPQMDKQYKNHGKTSAFLNQHALSNNDTIAGFRVAILIGDASDVDISAVMSMKEILMGLGAVVEVVGPHVGPLKTSSILSKTTLMADRPFMGAGPAQYDAICIPDGAANAKALIKLGAARRIIELAFVFKKTISAVAEGVSVLKATSVGRADGFKVPDKGEVEDWHGVIMATDKKDGTTVGKKFVEALKYFRHYDRPESEVV
ncbi:hypothetical protein HK101_011062 [Irineochytrium annulatum]|nr:hypothetical protein HK101_011062 [Irineochytrium annulatum]